MADGGPDGVSDGRGVTLGLLSRGEGGRHVVPVQECWLQDDIANAILRAVCTAAPAADLPA